MPSGSSTRRTVTAALRLVERRLSPLAVSFFTLADDGRIRTSVAAGPDHARGRTVQTLRGWKHLLHGVDRVRVPPTTPGGPTRILSWDLDDGTRTVLRTDRALADVHRTIGVINDTRLLLYDGGRILGGLTVWRPLRSDAWSSRQVRELSELQPLIELAYLAGIGVDPAIARWSLTPREREVADLLAAAASNTEIARALHISGETAKSHTRSIFTKVGVRSRRELIGVLRASEGGAARAPATTRTVTATELLTRLLAWAAESVDAVAAGAAILSARREVVTRVTATTPGANVDPRLADRLQATMLPAGRLSAYVSRLIDDPFMPEVVPADLATLAPEPSLVAAMTRTGIAAPVVLVLRIRGRVRGVVWIAHRRTSVPSERRVLTALRGAHPLIELAAAAVCAPRAGDGDAARRLSPRERTVADYAAAGLGNAEIARRMGVSEATVKAHMTRVLAKHGVRSRAQLMSVLADDRGSPDA